MSDNKNVKNSLTKQGVKYNSDLFNKDFGKYIEVQQEMAVKIENDHLNSLNSLNGYDNDGNSGDNSYQSNLKNKKFTEMFTSDDWLFYIGLTLIVIALFFTIIDNVIKK